MPSRLHDLQGVHFAKPQCSTGPSTKRGGPRWKGHCQGALKFPSDTLGSMENAIEEQVFSQNDQ